MPHYPRFTNKIMKYLEAPSGKVRIGKYVPPFEPVKEGHGFLGVVLEDVKSGFLQCHICGRWYGIFNSHLAKIHGTNSDEYRKRFGLSKSTALKSKKVRLRQSQVMIDMRKDNPKKFGRKFGIKNVFAGNRKDKPKSSETRNKYGVCNLQIMDRIILLKKKLGKTPTLIDLKEEYGGGFIFHIHKRYNSYVTLCRTLGFEPVTSNQNPKYSRQYFIEKALSNEASHRIFTQSESRNFYVYFPKGIEDLKHEVALIQW